ncbi:hypothetical protein PC9H_007773 [Pleurotus ostreatus]|uniref:Uncharacterized protein n=1 Tax=Pleurotus ostreatus TaxID=5322 RepID=A0A8H6ZUS0_PLEOS|nr:uncharacterized protein PC9H_007773 [Pleurotus ostreatus]KAF7428549.1 hypothetical protein PC9H_007773 [Pleurotus ostreatus]
MSGKAVEEDAASEKYHNGPAASDTGLTRRLRRGRELEPYQTIIDSLSRIRQYILPISQLFPRNNTVADLCGQADEVVLLVRCVARTVLEMCLDTFKPLQHPLPVSEKSEVKIANTSHCLLQILKPSRHISRVGKTLAPLQLALVVSTSPRPLPSLSIRNDAISTPPLCVGDITIRPVTVLIF